jgi:hypothetical protein
LEVERTFAKIKRNAPYSFMTLADYIRNEIFLPRLKAHRVLVVYDEHGRYRDACEALDSEQCTFIDKTGRPFSSRLQAMERWKAMLADTTFQSQMVLYCPETPIRRQVLILDKLDRCSLSRSMARPLRVG